MKYKVMDYTNIKGIDMAKFLSYEEIKQPLTLLIPGFWRVDFTGGGGFRPPPPPPPIIISERIVFRT